MKLSILSTAACTALVMLLGIKVQAGPVEDGKQAFTQYTCNTCHSLTTKKEPTHIGPPLYGVTKKPGRTKAWLVSWMSDPEEMLKNDALAKKLLAESSNVPMTPMLKLMNKKPDGSADTAAIKAKSEALYAFLKDNDSKPEGGGADTKKKKN